jgi:putative SOS response-associated peptidase YedK
MCGRYSNLMPWAELHALYSIHEKTAPVSNMRPGFNIAPTSTVAFAHKDRAGELVLDSARWWLVPFFAKKLPKAAMFYARIETFSIPPESTGIHSIETLPDPRKRIF